MSLAQLYEALSALDKGSEYISLIKSEISKLNQEAARHRSLKNESDVRIGELENEILKLTEKGIFPAHRF